MTSGLILVRHAETVDNANGVAQGWSDSPLTEKGRRQADLLARRSGELSPSSLWSSPLPRALNTARVIAGELGLEVRILDDLRELNCGRWEGMPFRRVREEDREHYERWKSDPDVACPGGESFNQVTERMERAVREISKDDPSSPLIVSHGTAIRLITCSLVGFPAALSYRLRQHNAAINVLERRGDDYFLRTWNDSAHCLVEENR